MNTSQASSEDGIRAEIIREINTTTHASFKEAASVFVSKAIRFKRTQLMKTDLCAGHRNRAEKISQLVTEWAFIFAQRDFGEWDGELTDAQFQTSANKAVRYLLQTEASEAAKAYERSQRRKGINNSGMVSCIAGMEDFDIRDPRFDQLTDIEVFAVLEAIKKLQESQKHLIIRRFIEDESFEEIAEELGIHVEATKKRIAAARSNLLKLLGEHLP